MRETIDTIVMLFSEAFEGPSDPRMSWFVDNVPDAGIFGVLAGISAVDASRSVDGSGARGSTIAANVEHLRWSMANASGAIAGQPYNPNWDASWDLTHVGAAEWDKLRESLRHEFEILRTAIGRQETLPGEFLPGVMALVPHAAYHLGTIRQMLEAIRRA